MVVDSSVVVALLNREAGFEALAKRLLQDAERRISPVSSVEAIMAIARKYADPASAVDAFLRQESIVIVPVDGDQAAWARHAFLTYGKGRQALRLTLGDCFSYAAAKALDAPLLFARGPFGQTDVRIA